MLVPYSLTLPALHAKPGICNSQASVRLSVCLSRRLTAAAACGGNADKRHAGRIYRSIQFTTNKIVYKIVGAMSKDLYIEISAHFGIESV